VLAAWGITTEGKPVFVGLESCAGESTDAWHGYCISLIWAVLDRASRGWRGFTMAPAGLRLLHDLRRTLLDPPTQLRHAGPPAAAEPDTIGAVA
jgi:hypothetical protein